MTLLRNSVTPPPFSPPLSHHTHSFEPRSPLPPLLSTAIPHLPSRRRPRVRDSSLLLPRRPRQESRHIKRPGTAGAALPRRGTHNAVHRVRLLPLLPLGAHLGVHCDPRVSHTTSGGLKGGGNSLLSTRYGIPNIIARLTSPSRIIGLRRIAKALTIPTISTHTPPQPKRDRKTQTFTPLTIIPLPPQHPHLQPPPFPSGNHPLPSIPPLIPPVRLPRFHCHPPSLPADQVDINPQRRKRVRRARHVGEIRPGRDVAKDKRVLGRERGDEEDAEGREGRARRGGEGGRVGEGGGGGEGEGYGRGGRLVVGGGESGGREGEEHRGEAHFCGGLVGLCWWVGGYCITRGRGRWWCL